MSPPPDSLPLEELRFAGDLGLLVLVFLVLLWGLLSKRILESKEDRSTQYSFPMGKMKPRQMNHLPASHLAD